MAEKRLFKELKLLIKNHPLLSHPQIVELAPENEENSIFKWHAVIAKPTKEDNPYYYNGQWSLDIVADQSYPLKPPKVKFAKLTPINHPNVDINTGEICLDILKSESWSPAWNLEHIVLAILMLIDTPEPDSPFNVDLANLYRSDKDAFESVVQYTIWKHGTLYDGEREASGVKAWAIMAYDISSEEEDIEDDSVEQQDSEEDRVEDREEDREQEREEDKEQEREEDSAEEINSEVQGVASSADGAAGEQLSNSLGSLKIDVDSANDLTRGELPVLASEHVRAAASPSQVEIVQNVGEEVKREFMEKATEVEANSPTLTGASSSLLHAAHESVKKAVSRQVDEICHSQPRHLLPPNRNEINTEKEKGVEEVKERFLRHIDEQVNQVRRFQECQRAVVQ